jgi:ABC-type dipeptide/oligopeptide/nickel transport system permease subunit
MSHWDTTLLVGAVGCALLIALVPLATALAPADPIRTDVPHANFPPGPGALLGTDHLGRDLFSRLLYGARASLIVALGSVAVSLVIGGGLGLVSAYMGGAVDMVLGRVMDVLMSIPILVLAMAMVATLGSGLLNTVIALSVALVPSFYRTIRGPLLAELGKEYVLAARVVGVAPYAIIARHLLPNVAHIAVVQTTLAISGVILVEASLGYLGLSVPPPEPSWGRMLAEARPFMVQAPWQAIFPGIAIMFAVLAFNLLGDGLRDRWDPRLRRLFQ